MVLLIALGILVLLVWAGRTSGRAGRRDWRLISAALALAAIVGGAFVVLRGGWVQGLGLVAAGIWLSSLARWPGPRPAAQPRPPPPEPGLSEAEARSILGLGPQATPDEVQSAYARLIRITHPDQGGTNGLAAQLNAARARLAGPKS